MPVNIKLIHPADFVRTTIDGALDLLTSIQALVSIASLIKTPGEYQVLIDTRGAEVKLSPFDLFELGSAVASYPSLTQSRIALLTAMDGAGQAHLLELIANNRGALIKPFTSFEEAITWLIVQQKDA